MLILTFVLVATPLSVNAESLQENNILMIFSWHKNMMWNFEIEKGFNQQFEGISSKPTLFYEYMDAGRFKNQDLVQIFKNYLQEKYSGLSINSVVFEGPPAAKLLISYPDIFKSSRKYVLNPGPLEANLPFDKLTVIPVNTDYAGAVDAILQVSQGKTVYLISGATNDGKKRVELVSRLISERQHGKKVVSLSDLSMSALLNKVSTLDEESSVIFFMLYFKDADGVRYTPYEVVQDVCQYATAPVYTAWSVFMGTGVVGGYLLSGKMTGKVIASMLINPNRSELMKPKQLMNQFHGLLFDWRQLDKWGISEKSLPVGSTILYKEPFFYELYFKEIVTGSLVLVLVISFFWNLILKRQIRARLVAEEKLRHKNEELEILATTDRLTGLFNRIKLDYSLQNEVRRFKRYGHVLSVIIMDIDHFKKINDTYGHQAGDEVLKQISTILQANLRQVDIIGRWGGEEFLIICPETPLQYAVRIADKLKEKVRSYKFNHSIMVTASFGISEITTDESDTDIIKKADEALYKAKANGRNRVEYV